MAGKPKIVFIDIETSPSLGWVWGVWEQNVLEVEQDWFMLSFAVKWNDSKTKVYALPDYRGYKKNKTNDRLLVLELWNILNSADIVVAHNADAFDIKKANARFLVHGLQPPAPYKTVDTLKLARSKFKFDSNRLDDLARYLGIGRKLATHGKKTWLGCMEGDEKSWRTMVRYNKQDVDLLYELYMRLRPWATNHPNLGLIKDRPNTCPICGSIGKMQARGYLYTRTSKRRRYQCTHCGGWSTGEPIKTEITLR